MAVEIEQFDRIRLIKMAGQASTQSFSMAFLPTIAKAIDDGLKDAQTKAIVLTGDGRFFSAGADINAFQNSIESNTAPELIRNLAGVLHPLLQRMRTSSTIVVAALNGVSAGGGLGLALACDARVGTNDARMAASYAGMGLSPDGSTYGFFLVLWASSVLAASSQNEVWSVQGSAHEYGAIDVLVEPDSLMDTAIGLATVWSSWGQHTKEATKHLLHVQTDNEFSTHLDHERTLIEAAGTTRPFEKAWLRSWRSEHRSLTESVHLKLHVRLLVSSTKAQESNNKGDKAPAKRTAACEEGAARRIPTPINSSITGMNISSRSTTDMLRPASLDTVRVSPTLQVCSLSPMSSGRVLQMRATMTWSLISK